MSIKEEILTFDPLEKIQLIDELLQNLDSPSKEIDKIWAKEAEERIKARDSENIKTIPSSEVIAKLHKIAAAQRQDPIE